jgi:cellulose synthase/poly-beta-1,6-N-acetylglucosamine synthase-like glycosyltransferase
MYPQNMIHMKMGEATVTVISFFILFFNYLYLQIISGAATLSCIFTVIDTICSSSEETKEPLTWVGEYKD